ncbi:MAG: hypothetical protein KGD63_09465 [Candidatus Lokiarchaeota archaeon]|nr:hypothetical protein [Candidatus Lokiarchaeota archaeon]
MNIIIIIEFTIGLFLAVGTSILSLLLHLTAKKRNITSLSLLNLFILSFGIFKFFDSFSILFENYIFARISGIVFLLIVYFLVCWINYIIKESYFSIGLLFLASMSLFHIYLVFQPESIQIITYAGYQRIGWADLFLISIMIHRVIIGFYIIYWGLKTWKNAPMEMKRLTSQLFGGVTLGFISFLIFALLLYVVPIFIIFKNMVMFGTLLVVSYTIIKEPKILYVLPFIINRLIIRDHNGYPLYDHDWTLSDINEKTFTGFLNAVEIMSEEIINIGGLLDINLQNGVLTLNRSKYITVGLTASKISKLLKESIVNFTIDFEQKFERLLKKSCIDMKEYLSASDLINKHFSNIPYRILSKKNQKVILSSKYTIPSQLENKFKDIFTNKDEYEEIINDLAKAPISISSDFFTLYDDLNNEPKEIDFNYKLKKKRRNQI